MDIKIKTSCHRVYFLQWGILKDFKATHEMINSVASNIRAN